ncbi:MAG: HAMP domain-containing protein [wastewater metagenome]|nr:HAMP domain-containing protein [Candidatus Loosdrechtia aerotolerans]
MFKPTKSKLSIFFLILTFLPLIVMRMVIYPITFETLKREIIKDLEIATRKQAELVTRWVEKCRSDAQRIANNPFVLQLVQSTPESGEHTELFRKLDETGYFDYLWKEFGHKEVFISDPGGVVRIASEQEFVGMDISAKDYFRSAISGASFTSGIISSDIPLENESGIGEVGMPALFVSEPIKDMVNRTIGTVTLLIGVSEINTMMQNIHIGTTGETYLINGYGYMLTESRFTENLRKQGRIEKRSALALKVVNPKTNVLTKGVRECLKGSGGFDTEGYPDYRGVNVLGFWHWMPDYGWGVIAEIDVDEGYGALYTLRNYVMFVFGLVSIGVIIVAFFLGKKISAPVHYISEKALEIARGNYNTRIHYTSDDEIGKLASAINSMAETLESGVQGAGTVKPANKTSPRESKNSC